MPGVAVVFKVAKVLGALIPIAKGVAKAMRADSPGGKKITEDEWLSIVLNRTPVVLKRLNELEPDQD